MGFAETFKALSDPVRREILVMLKNGRMSAGEIAAHFDMTGATISYHLSQLKKADLLYETRYKNYIYYEINVSVFEEVMLWFSQFRAKMEDEDGGQKGDDRESGNCGNSSQGQRERSSGNRRGEENDDDKER